MVVQDIVVALPELLGTVQGQLLDLISLLLARRPHKDTLSHLHLNALHQAIMHGALPHLLQPSKPAPWLHRHAVPATIGQDYKAGFLQLLP